MKVILFLGLLWIVLPLQASILSFTGSFTADDDIQLFTFSTSTVSSITIKTLSYAGGTNSSGATIARGGFDPILSLFDSSGLYLLSNDDGNNAPLDLSGSALDAYLTVTLNPGIYTISITQFDNFVAGPTLSDGFAETGNGNFTGSSQFDPGCASVARFCDTSGNLQYNARDGHWAADFLNVDAATQLGVPEPSTLLLLGSALIAIALTQRLIRAA